MNKNPLFIGIMPPNINIVMKYTAFVFVLKCCCVSLVSSQKPTLKPTFVSLIVTKNDFLNVLWLFITAYLVDQHRNQASMWAMWSRVQSQLKWAYRSFHLSPRLNCINRPLLFDFSIVTLICVCLCGSRLATRLWRSMEWISPTWVIKMWAGSCWKCQTVN